MRAQSLKKSVFPQTHLGILSSYLFLFFIFLLVIGQTIVIFQGPLADQTLFDNPLLSSTMILSGLCAITTFVIGFISIIKKERAIIVFITTAIGFLVFLFLLGEFLVPH